MKKAKAKKRHRWQYPSSGDPTREKPATCACGASYYIDKRPRVGVGAYSYGPSVADAIYSFRPGTCATNPSPIPPCTRKD